MSWPPESGRPLPNAERAYGLEEKLAGYTLKLGHASLSRKAEGFQRVLAIELADLDYLSSILDGIRGRPMSGVRPAGAFGFHCEVIVPVAGLRGRADRTANVLTAWEVRWDGDDPRLITAYIVSRVE